MQIAPLALLMSALSSCKILTQINDCYRMFITVVLQHFQRTKTRRKARQPRDPCSAKNKKGSKVVICSNRIMGMRRQNYLYPTSTILPPTLYINCLPLQFQLRICSNERKYKNKSLVQKNQLLYEPSILDIKQSKIPSFITAINGNKITQLF